MSVKTSAAWFREVAQLRMELAMREAFIADAIALLRSHQNKELVEPFLDKLFEHKSLWITPASEAFKHAG
jgi:hypothetical protein